MRRVPCHSRLKMGELIVLSLIFGNPLNGFLCKQYCDLISDISGDFIQPPHNTPLVA